MGAPLAIPAAALPLNLGSIADDNTLALLPVLQLRRQPYSLRHHAEFAPMFTLQGARRQMWKCARQVGKSHNLLASRLLRARVRHHYNVLVVTPRFSQMKRLSTEIFAPLVEESLFPSLFANALCQNTVDCRTLSNGSKFVFSFALLDANRIRSISANECCLDEAADIRPEFIPVILETMSGQTSFFEQLYTGTPKTFDNPMETLWAQSSQAEQVIRCAACNHWNVAAAALDLLRMIGPEGVICAKCGRPLNPLDAQWVHGIPERAAEFEGYHVSQVTHFAHWHEPDKWALLLRKQKEYPGSLFYNECLGESADSADRLMTLSILRRICNAEQPNELQAALARRSRYQFLAMGVDWGGGGAESASYTAVCLAGRAFGSDVIEVLYLEKLDRALAHDAQVQHIVALWRSFAPQVFAHDYCGIGAVIEAAVRKAGIPDDRIMGLAYCFAPRQQIVTFVPPTHTARRAYSLDKPRSIALLCAYMKAGKVLLPAFDSTEACLKDFLNIYEDRQSTSRSDLVTIKIVPGRSDDCVHAMNYACSAIWHVQQSYPNVAEALRIQSLNAELDDEEVHESAGQ